MTLFLFILEALKTDQDTLKRWDHLKRCICSVPALWELIHTSMLFTSQLIKLSRDLESLGKKSQSWFSDWTIRVDNCTCLNFKVLRPKNQCSLKQLLTKFIQTKRYLTLGFRSAYAKYLFPFALSKWQSEKSFPSPMQIERKEETIPFLFSYPAEKYTAAESLLFKSIDSSHNLTHLRVCTSTLFWRGGNLDELSRI